VGCGASVPQPAASFRGAERMTAFDPGLRDQLLAAGLANQRQRAFAAAEQCYKLVLAQTPRDPEALYRMGVLALQCANAAGAVHYLR
jgi:hypothetical protein